MRGPEAHISATSLGHSDGTDDQAMVSGFSIVVSPMPNFWEVSIVLRTRFEPYQSLPFRATH